VHGTISVYLILKQSPLVRRTQFDDLGYLLVPDAWTSTVEVRSSGERGAHGGILALNTLVLFSVLTAAG